MTSEPLGILVSDQDLRLERCSINGLTSTRYIVRDDNGWAVGWLGCLGRWIVGYMKYYWYVAGGGGG